MLERELLEAEPGAALLDEAASGARPGEPRLLAHVGQEYGLLEGRQPGADRRDRVVAYLPNIAETVAAFLACASIGAVWSSCSPEFGVQAVVDRLAQIEPKVLLAADGYRYGGRDFDRLDAVAAIRAGLPTLEQTVLLPYLSEEPRLAGTRP